MQLHWTKHQIELLDPFRLSYGTYQHRTGYLVQIDFDEYSGLGECVVVPYYVEEKTIDQTIMDVQSWVSQQIATPDLVRAKLLSTSFHPFVRSAVDAALWDIEGKMQHKSVHDILFPGVKSDQIETTWTITASSEDELTAKIQKHPWPSYKLKVGFDGDMDLVDAYFKISKKPLRLDANAGWSLKEAIDKLTYLGKYPIASVEQPLIPSSWDEQRQLFRDVRQTFIADEALQSLDDLNRCKDAFHVANIKLMKVGGITPALTMAEEAKKLGLGVMIGCMTETSVGIAADAQLIPVCEIADLDGNLLIKEDQYHSTQANSGWIRVPSGPGLGISPRKLG